MSHNGAGRDALTAVNSEYGELNFPLALVHHSGDRDVVRVARRQGPDHQLGVRDTLSQETSLVGSIRQCHDVALQMMPRNAGDQNKKLNNKGSSKTAEYTELLEPQYGTAATAPSSSIHNSFRERSRQAQTVWAQRITATLHSTTQHSTAQQCSTAQRSTAQHIIVDYSTTQHRKAHRKTAQHNAALHCTAQYSTAQRSTAQHSTAQHSTAQHSTAQHSTAQHSTAQHNTAQHSTAQRSTS